MTSPTFSLRSYMATSALARIAIEEAVAQWPSLHDCVVTKPSTGHTIEITPCHSYTSSELDALGVPLRFRFEEKFAAREPDYEFIVTNNATVVGDTGVIVNGDGHLVLESLFPHDRNQPFQRIQLIPEFETCQDDVAIEEDVFLLYRGGGFKNFWHFHVDMLPTVTFLKEVGLFDKIKIAIPTNGKWQREALRRIGVEKERIVEVGNNYNHFRRCFLFSTIFQPTLTVPNELARRTFGSLRQAACGGETPQAPQTRPRHVYIARTDSVARMMVNEAALVGAMRDLGFEIVVLSDLSYSDQVTLFASSSVIVGAHGAGLTNILVADRNALIVEIFPFGILQAPHYHFLAKSLGLKYEMFVSRIKPSVSPHEHWTIEIDAFIFRLVSIMYNYNLCDRDEAVNCIPPHRPKVEFPGFFDADFSSEEAMKVMTLFGFSGLEYWGCWATEKKAAIRFNFALPLRFRLSLEIEVFDPSLSMPFTLSVGITRHSIVSKVALFEAIFDNPKASTTIWIEAPGAVSPAMVSDQPFGDGRLLSLAIKRISIVEVD